MARSLYIASMAPRAGKSVVTLGLMELLIRRSASVGYFRPVIPTALPDPRITLVRERYQLEPSAEDMYAWTAEEVRDLQAEGRTDEVLERIVADYKELESRCDFVLVDGTDYTGSAAALEFDFNAEVATNIGAPVLALIAGHDLREDDVVGSVRVARESLAAAGCTLAVTVVNRIAPELVDKVEATLDEIEGHEPIYVLPEVPLLGMPTVEEVIEAVGGRDVRGESVDLGREVTAYKIAAMQLPNFLDHVVDGALVVTPGDRSDVILGSLASRLSNSYPDIAGLVLTGGLTPEASVLKLIDGMATSPTPIFSVETDTYETARDVTRVRAVIRPKHERKIATALGLFEEHVDIAELTRRIEVTYSRRRTPLMFEYELIERARADRKRIVLPEGTDDRILTATQTLVRRGVVDVVLLGNASEVRERVSALGLDIGDTPIVDPATSEDLEQYTDTYLELRRHKGIQRDAAHDAMLDVSYFGTMMVYAGAVDGMVSGAAHTTGHTIRPAFEFIKTKPGVDIVSSVFFMCLPDRVLVYGDCAVNPNPDAQQLADIAISSAETAAIFGVEPRIAMLSYSTGESGKGSDVETVREATGIVRERRPDLEVDGPIQYDAAVDVSVGQSKMPGSKVAGRATVFIFPDLNTGNNTYKAVQRSAGVVAIGPVLQGLNKPINDLSRGALVADVVNTVAITAIQAQQAQDKDAT
jgi:phosphate acetyltransferase